MHAHTYSRSHGDVLTVTPPGFPGHRPRSGRSPRPPAAGRSAAHSHQWNARMWAILLVLCGALFLDALDVSMIGVALPVIRTDLHLSTS
jgi:hypothetical protein